MLRIRLLGGAVVDGDTGPIGGAAAQRKSLAALALLVPSGDRGISRDKIVAYLWPETEPEKAAHRFTQVLYALRRDLAADDVFLGSGELRLNPDRISSDVREFTIARHASELERAVELYGGPFLDGFFLDDSPEFERWVDNERAGLARQFTEVLETLAAESAARGDHRRAAQWWHRLAEHDPLSSHVTVHLMSALAAAGNRAEALEQARSYQTLLEREADAAPNPAVIALAEQLRRQAPQGLLLSPEAEPALSVAVLPFANLSPLPANDYFGEGLAEEVRSALAGRPGVKVTARMSANAYRNTDLDAREIGRRLNVRALLEGTIRQAGTQVRLSVQLIDVIDGFRVWSQKYERTVTEVFAVQDELAGLIVTGVQEPLAALARGSPSACSQRTDEHGR